MQPLYGCGVTGIKDENIKRSRSPNRGSVYGPYKWLLPYSLLTNSTSKFRVDEDDWADLYSAGSDSHPSRIDTLAGSRNVNPTPIPTPLRE